MVASAMTRRAALAALGAFALSLTVDESGAVADTGLRFRGIRINVAPLRATSGDPTAAWMEQALMQALPRVLGPYLAPDERNAAVLEVQIDWIYLGPSSGGTGPAGASQDTVVGTFIVRGPRAESCRKRRSGQSAFTTQWLSTRRWSRTPITRAWWRWRRPSPVGRRGSSGSRRPSFARRARAFDASKRGAVR